MPRLLFPLLAVSLVVACGGGSKSTEPPTVCLAWPTACQEGKPLISDTPLSTTKTSEGRTCYEMAYTEDWPGDTGEHIRLCGRPGAASAAITCYAGSRRLGPYPNGHWPEACDIANVALGDNQFAWITPPSG